jgi:hypothetical protein
MPRLHPAQSNWTSGELSPKVHLGRIDFQKYYNGAETIENWTVFPQGGLTRRPGTHFVASVKSPGKRPRLVPFIVSTTTAYILEFGETYIRIYANNAQILSAGTPVEITTTYAEADLFSLDFAQSADVLYIVHPNYTPRRLERYSDTIWKLRAVVYAPPPSREFGHRPAGTLTPGAISGQNITLTSSLNDFLNADVGREVLVTAGANAGARAGIKTFTSATVVVANICETFVDVTATARTGWKLTDSPRAGCTPAAATPIGKSTTLTLDANGWKGVAAGGYQTGDCSRFVLLNGGMFQITSVDSVTQVTATIRGVASGTTKAEVGTWTLEEAAWSPDNGFPAAISAFEDRFYYGGTLAQPDTIWGSKTGDYENFGFGTLDDDAVAFTLNSPQLNAIRWIRGGRALRVGTAGAEFVGTGGADNPITPTNVLFKDETTFGSAPVSPSRIGNVILFLTRSLKKIREFVFSFEVDSHVAPDLLLLAEHLTCDTTLTQIAYQQDPDSILWAVRSDGQLLTCTYLRDQNVVAWTRQVTRTGDAFESVAVIPHPDGDREQVWVATRRAPSDPLYGAVVLLMHFEGINGEQPADLTGGFVDATSRHIEGFASGTVGLSTTEQKFGTTSVKITTGGGLGFTDHPDWDFGANDFTIEMFVFLAVYPDTSGDHGSSLWAQDGGAAVFAPVNFAVGEDGKLHVWASSNGSSWDILSDVSGAIVLTLGTWHHVALTRQGSTWRLFVDGVLDVTFSAPGTLVTSSTTVQIGRFQNEADFVKLMYIDELRVTNGAAWYDANFVVPTSALPASNPGDRRYIEYLDDAGQFYPTLNVDAGLTCDTGSAVTTVGNLGHLECSAVAIVGDGAVYPSQIVVNGQITISPAAQQIEVGLAYTSTLKTIRPEIQSGAGTMQAMKVRWAEIKVRLLRTLGLTVQGDIIPFRKAGDPMDAPPPIFTGDKTLSVTGWEDANQILIEQTQPLPATVVLLTGILDVGGG